MFSNILNSIPVVGHAKGVLHFMAGDIQGGQKAMYESTRSTAVIGGGALGMAGGPVGMALAGAAAGAMIDTVTSIATDKPQGSLASVGEIVNDIAHGEVPLRSVGKTVVMMGCDALSGMGGGIVTNVAETAIKNTGKSIGTEMLKSALVSQGKTAVAAGICGQAGLASEFRTEYIYIRPINLSNSKPAPSTASGSGSEPPDNNKGNDENPHEIEEPEEPDHWSTFLELFGATNLDDISIRGRKIFSGLVRGRKNTLKKLIKNVGRGGYLYGTMKLVLEIFNSPSIADEDIVFENFLSLTNFVDTYIGELVGYYATVPYISGTREGSFEARRQRAYRDVMDDNTLTQDILYIFENLRNEISKFSLEPNFRNIFSAIYHYYKHRVIRKNGTALTVSEYIDLIISLLEKLKTLEVYTELGSSRNEITFDRYFVIYGTRVRIVVKFQGGQNVLSSCYLKNDSYDDYDGDEFVDSEEID